MSRSSAKRNYRLELVRLERYLYLQFGVDSVSSSPVIRAFEDALKDRDTVDALRARVTGKKLRHEPKPLRVRKEGKLIIHDFMTTR